MNNYSFIDKNTNEIIELDNVIAVNYKVAPIISNLNKKGYHVINYLVAGLTKPFALLSFIDRLYENNILDNDKYDIKELIKYDNTENTTITFDKEYKFDTLPKGFKLEGQCLTYVLSILKDNDEVSFKDLVELSHEIDDSIKELEEWSNII